MRQEPPEELSDGIPETVVVTNYAKSPAYLHVVFDNEQTIIVQMDRNLLCLCDPFLRKWLNKREGELTGLGTIGFELIRPFWDRQHNFAMVELTGNNPRNRHILLVDKSSLPTLQELVIAMLSEETLDKLRQNEYGVVVRDHRTRIINFTFHLHDYDSKTQKLFWENDSRIIDICPSCSCRRARGPRERYWDWS